MMSANYVTFVESWRKPVTFDAVREVTYEGVKGDLVVRQEGERHSFNINDIQDFQFKVSSLSIVDGSIQPVVADGIQEIEFIRERMRFTIRYEYEVRPGQKVREKLDQDMAAITAFKGGN